MNKTFIQWPTNATSNSNSLTSNSNSHIIYAHMKGPSRLAPSLFRQWDDEIDLGGASLGAKGFKGKM